MLQSLPEGKCSFELSQELLFTNLDVARLSKSRKLQHSGIEEHGETVFVSTGDASYEDAVQSWLAEESDFNGLEKFGDGNASKYARFSEFLDPRWYYVHLSDESYSAMRVAELESFRRR